MEVRFESMLFLWDDKIPTMFLEFMNEGVSKCTPSVFYAQSPDFHKLGLCYYLKILYL